MKLNKSSIGRLFICAMSLALVLSPLPKAIAQVVCVCYDSSEPVRDQIHFCTTPSKVECGNNVIVAGTAVANGYQTVSGCGAFWGNPHHDNCSGTRVGSCPP